jgi:hypothetical protein
MRASLGAVETRAAADYSAKEKLGMRSPPARCGEAVAVVRCRRKLLAVAPGVSSICVRLKAVNGRSPVSSSTSSCSTM